MHVLRTNFEGDPNVGLYGFATDKYLIAGADKYLPKLKETLKVQAHSVHFINMDLAKLFSAGNSSGMVIPEFVEDFDKEEIDKIRSHIKVLSIKTPYTSLGNLILMNDNGIVLSPFLRKHKSELSKFFGIECQISKIALMNIVGSLGFATNKGCLVHPKIREKEKRLIEKTLQVTVDVSTVNFGSPYPGSGIIANSNGFVVSEWTSGPELGRITDVLGFL